MQNHYITGNNKSIADSRGALGGATTGAPVIGSIDLGKKTPLVRGGSDRGLGRSSIGRANSLYKQTLQKSRFGPSPGSPMASPDSFNSMGSDDGKETTEEEEKSDLPPKLKIKASSFRNPKPSS